MKINAILLYFASLFMVGCTSSTTVFEESLPEGDLQFLLVPLTISELDLESSTLPEEYVRGFQLNNRSSVKALFQMQPKGQVKSMPIPNYIGVFTQGGEIISNCFINEELTEIHTSAGNFEITPEVFTDYVSEFSELQTVTTRAEDKETALKVREALHKNGVFMEVLGENPDEPAWSKFDGKMVIGLAQSIQENKDVERVEQKLAACMGNCKVTDISTRDGLTTCEVYCNGLKEKLPSDYRLVSDYQEFSDIEIVSLGTEKSVIKEIIAKSGLKKVRVQ